MNWIQITKDYAISSDDRCWMVKQYAGVDSETGKPKWPSITWHGTYDQAVNSLAQRLLRQGKCKTLPDLKKHAEGIRELLSRAQKKVEI